MDDEKYLDTFLSEAVSDLSDVPAKSSLKEVDIFRQEQNSEKVVKNKKNYVNALGENNCDSDYNLCVQDVEHILNSNEVSNTHESFNQSSTHDISWRTNSALLSSTSVKPLISQQLNLDTIFSIRIINPLISSSLLQERMVGRELIQFQAIKRFISGGTSNKNWVIGAVIVSKSAIRTSQKGNQFLIWTLSDLKNDIKTVSVFLFGTAYKNLWKTSVGTVVGILNPAVLEKNDRSKDEACLSVDNAQKVMILGKSKDFGTCKSIKRNGEPCSAVVNTSHCAFCVYHVKQEYQKCSKRSELQSTFSGRGLNALRSKILGKDGVFNGAKLYAAKRNTKLEKEDQGKLQKLSCETNITFKKEMKQAQKRQAATNLEVTNAQRLKDLSMLEKLEGCSRDTSFNSTDSFNITTESSKNMVAKLTMNSNEKSDANSIAKNANYTTEVVTKCNKLDVNGPTLSTNNKGIVDLSSPINSRLVAKARFNALQYIKKNGPISKSDPNSLKCSKNNKRSLHDSEIQEGTLKKAKIENGLISDRFKKMMESTSKHIDLLKQHEQDSQEKYFVKLEAKEKMEEKMVNTHKVNCKAVRCLQCKYTSFSAAQKCKEEKHPIRVFNATKRFFKCGQCKNRTVCLQFVPTDLCKNCGALQWERTGMIKENIITGHPVLSIRGGEQKFINSVATDDNINLLYPV